MQRFGYVGVFNGEHLQSFVPLAHAKERFIEALTASPLQHTVIRPTAFFSDMRAFLDMARRGRVFVVGDGSARVNPISGADLAAFSVDAVLEGRTTADVGGPEVFTYEQIARLAAATAGGSAPVTHMPAAPLRVGLRVLSSITPVRIHGPAQFLLAVMTHDMVAPSHGDRTLQTFFRQLSSGEAPQ